MLLGRLELHRVDLVAAELGQDLAALLLGRRLRERPAEPLGRRARGAAACGRGGGRPERLDPARVAGRAGQQQVSGDALGRCSCRGQRLGRRRVPRLPLARREVLVERGAHDGMDEPQTRPPDEDVGPHEVVRRRGGGLLAEPRHLTGELQLGVVAQHGDGSGQLVRRRAERGEPMQDEAAHGRRADRLDVAGGSGRRLDPGRFESGEQLAQEQRVAAGRRMACAAERLRRVRAQALPRERHRGGLAERPGIQHDRGGTRRHLPPHRPGLVRRWSSGEQHRERQALGALRQVGEEPQGVVVDPVAVIDQDQQRAPVGEVDDEPVEAVERLEAP